MGRYVSAGCPWVKLCESGLGGEGAVVWVTGLPFVVPSP